MRSIIVLVCLAFVGCLDSSDPNPNDSEDLESACQTSAERPEDQSCRWESCECGYCRVETAPNGALCPGGSCNAGTCVQWTDCSELADGILCGGDQGDATYGVCQDGLCVWDDYQCKFQNDGTHCDGYGGGTCSRGDCCYMCVDENGYCVVREDAKGNVIQGGVACPVGS